MTSIVRNLAVGLMALTATSAALAGPIKGTHFAPKGGSPMGLHPHNSPGKVLHNGQPFSGKFSKTYHTSGGKFWSYSCYSKTYGCNVYWCPSSCRWFCYYAPSCCYCPVEECPVAYCAPVCVTYPLTYQVTVPVTYRVSVPVTYQVGYPTVSPVAGVAAPVGAPAGVPVAGPAGGPPPAPVP